MINESLARFSNYAIYGAMFVYFIAFFAYTAEWVFGRKSAFVVDAAQQSAAKVPAQAATLVAAGQAGKSGAADAVVVPDDLSGLDGLDDFDDEAPVQRRAAHWRRA